MELSTYDCESRAWPTMGHRHSTVRLLSSIPCHCLTSVDSWLTSTRTSTTTPHPCESMRKKKRPTNLTSSPKEPSDRPCHRQISPPRLRYAATTYQVGWVHHPWDTQTLLDTHNNSSRTCRSTTSLQYLQHSSTETATTQCLLRCA